MDLVVRKKPDIERGIPQPHYVSSCDYLPSKISEEQVNFFQVQYDLSCWSEICTDLWLTSDACCWRACILFMDHKGHQGIMKLNWWWSKGLCGDIMHGHRLPTVAFLKSSFRANRQLHIFKCTANARCTYSSTETSLVLRKSWSVAYACNS